MRIKHAFVLAIGILISAAASANVVPLALHLYYDSPNSPSYDENNRISFPTNGEYCLLAHFNPDPANQPTATGECVTLGTSLSYASGKINVSAQSWSSLTGKPTTVSAAGLSDAVTTSALATALAAQPAAKAYEGTTLRTGAFPIFKSSTVSSGTAVFYLTADNTSGGTALCTNVIQDSVQVTVSDATASYQMSWAFTNSNKTLTVTANKLTTANILTGLLGQAQANASVVKLSVFCN